MRHFSTTLGALIFSVATAYASISGQRSFKELEQTADLIVVGSVSGGTKSGSTLSFSIQVERVIKGNSAMTGTQIAVDWTPEPQGGPPEAGPPRLTGHGLWFLTRSPSAWELQPVANNGVPFTSAYIPEPPGTSLTAYTYSPGAALSDKVASEISGAIETATASGGTTYLLSLYKLLDELQSPVTQQLWSRLSVSELMNQKLFGLGGLIRSGNTGALQAAFESASSFASYPLEAGILLQSIRGDFRATDSNSVGLLGRIATQVDCPSDLRHAAAKALASIHSKDALPYLAALLDDQDRGLRAEGIGGLASFANGLPVQTPANTVSLGYLQLPTSAPYKTDDTVAHLILALPSTAPDESSYLSFWKSWWSQNRGSLGY